MRHHVIYLQYNLAFLTLQIRTTTLDRIYTGASYGGVLSVFMFFVVYHTLRCTGIGIRNLSRFMPLCIIIGSLGNKSDHQPHQLIIIFVETLRGCRGIVQCHTSTCCLAKVMRLITCIESNAQRYSGHRITPSALTPIPSPAVVEFCRVSCSICCVSLCYIYISL